MDGLIDFFATVTGLRVVLDCFLVAGLTLGGLCFLTALVVARGQQPKAAPR